MQSWDFKAIVLANEINLNVIASHFGISTKFKWEDPLVLSDNMLKGIIRVPENKCVYLYHYGAITFINMEHHEIMDMVNYIKQIDLNLKNNQIDDNYSDGYRLEVDDEHEYALYNDLMTANQFMDYYLDIISMVLAKSTSLRRIEVNIDKLLDSIEDIINYLDTGKFNMSDEQLAKTSAKVLRFKYNTISYLMVLEKPKSAWNNEDIENFYMEMIVLFDMTDRYEKITHKSEILRDITDVFSSITHEKRGTRLEVMVIVLILFELIVSLIEFFLRMH